LEEEEGRPAELLRRFGLDMTGLREHLGAPGGPASATLDAVLLESSALMRGRGSEEPVTSEYFLLAVLRSDSGLSRQLEARGLDWAGLEQSVRAGRAPAPQLSQPIDLHAPAGQIASARALDANANRAREALRVLEDYCRFALDDRFLTEQAKSLRHELAAALGALPVSLLLQARETDRDVGTAVGAATERHRDGPRHVALVNLKRLQEALRSLEEYGKVFDPATAEKLEQLRYRSYTLERALLLGADARERLAGVRLYVLLTGAHCAAAVDWTIQEAAAGGAQVFQLREKGLSDRELLERARRVREWCRRAGALFIVNDRPDIARLCEADGVHLGQDDMPVKEARQVLGPGALIGVSTHDLGQVRRAVLDGADYIGVGPAFPSRTKQFEHLAGPEFIRQAVAETSLPAFAIGGIGPENIGAVIGCGARRVAVGAAVTMAEEPRLAALALREALDAAEG
ncbi:MAG TPA: thiamine phosphate synthase, partial [Gemmataceae bacterium]